MSSGLVHQLEGDAIATAYGAGTASSPLNVGRARRVRFFVRVVTAAESDLTSVTVKLKQRYNADGVTLGYVDLPSNTDAAPSVHEVEHVFTVAAGQTNDFAFYLDRPETTLDLALDVKADAAGVEGDSVSIYAVTA